MPGDWIRLHRKLLDSAVFSDEWLLKLWIWCLLRAGYCEKNRGGRTIPAGAFSTGRHAAADDLNVSPSKWYRGIHQLASFGMVSLSTSNEWTTITICHWDTYQCSDAVRGQPVNNERTTDEQRADTIQEGEEREEVIGVPITDSSELLSEFHFDTVGSQQNWTCPLRLIDAMTTAYPGIDVDAQMRIAVAWCLANKSKRKTPRGMPKFLNGWMERAQNRQRDNGRPRQRELLPGETQRVPEASEFTPEHPYHG